MKNLILCAALVALTTNVFADQDDCGYLTGKHTWNIRDPEPPTVINNCSYHTTEVKNIFDKKSGTATFSINLNEGFNNDTHQRCPPYSQTIPADIITCHPNGGSDIFSAGHSYEYQGSFYKKDNSLTLNTNYSNEVSIISAKLKS